MRKHVILTGLFALVACGKGGEQITAVDQGTAAETGAAAEVAKLDETQRNGVLERAVRASGAACPTVVKSERVEVRHGVRGWKAHCDNGTAHLLEIHADGTANVTSRTN